MITMSRLYRRYIPQAVQIRIQGNFNQVLETLKVQLQTSKVPQDYAQPVCIVLGYHRSLQLQFKSPQNFAKKASNPYLPGLIYLRYLCKSYSLFIHFSLYILGMYVHSTTGFIPTSTVEFCTREELPSSFSLHIGSTVVIR